MKEQPVSQVREKKEPVPGASIDQRIGVFPRLGFAPDDQSFMIIAGG